ncbi:MAG TPA: alpha/beta hydrolase fold domain-containing protein, partial [Solirubrobacteraceae bacterium]
MTTHDSLTMLAETRAFVAELERLLATLPPMNSRPPEEARRDRREGRGIFPKPVFLPEAQVRQIDGPAGPLTLRTIPPDGESGGVFLHFHGGGWALGNCDEQDLRLQRVARNTGLTVVSVGYRLAPENPYPAGADDCEAAALWLLEHSAELVPDGGPLVVGGDSAGGNLTAVTLLRLRDRHGITG